MGTLRKSKDKKEQTAADKQMPIKVRFWAEIGVQ